MNEFLLEYGHILAYIIIAFFLVFWISIPFYLGECAKTKMLINKIEKGDQVAFYDLDKRINNLEGLEYAFGSLPNENTAPHLFNNPAFKKHIEDLKRLQRFYLKLIIILSILMICLFVGRIYVVQLKSENNSISVPL